MCSSDLEAKVIGDVEYVVRPLPAMKSLIVLARILRMAAPGFANLRSLRDGATAGLQLLAGALVELDEDTLAYVCSELQEVTRVRQGGKEVPLKPLFDLHFEGRINELFDWLRFAAEVTYGPLAERLRAELAKAEAAPAAAGRFASRGASQIGRAHV